MGSGGGEDEGDRFGARTRPDGPCFALECPVGVARVEREVGRMGAAVEGEGGLARAGREALPVGRGLGRLRGLPDGFVTVKDDSPFFQGRVLPMLA